jgi:hypothetical protein
MAGGFGFSQEGPTPLGLVHGSAQEALSVLAKRIQEYCPKLRNDSLGREPARGDFARTGSQRRPDRYRQPPSSQIPGRLFAKGNSARWFTGRLARANLPGKPCEGEVAPADDSWRKPLLAQEDLPAPLK